MSATVPGLLQAHIDSGVTALARLWTLTTRSGDVYRYTSSDDDIAYGGYIYTSRTGFDSTAIEDKSDLSADNLDLTGLLGDDITKEQIRAGTFDGAEVIIDIVNWRDPSQGIIRRRKGTLGEVSKTRGGGFQVELRGQSQALAEQTLKTYTPGCNVDLGSARCGVPLAPDEVARATAYALGAFVVAATDPLGEGQAAYQNRIYECTMAGTTDAVAPVYDITVGNTTADGTAVFTAREAWTRHGEVATVTDSRVVTLTLTEARAVDVTWFRGGLMVAESGLNAGVGREIVSWNPALDEVRAFLPFPFVFAVGDRVRLSPGCDKSISTCRDKFANAINFRGFPYLPGTDWLLKYATGE